MTPLIIASLKGHLGVVQYLISVGLDKDASDDNETCFDHENSKIRSYLSSK
ncbi:hypothetical protein TVAG_179690 [Trichomonas vaginalis G3]|uniref:Uncharacterized protein n=1 Tax=Trichomonas vaginalis (strain ATCC PRA-98 / G3) TaxID=412133 RepID=A2F451_TRIV3|nr:Ankyrin repeat family [Trichomonas vaginalis G3]EAY00298.1 hypothetical protein TVAG_179690 [Trichomonas vaginalis G3]KAI5490871.1 Ankyrin repeat family [Trichomonas vaginalis G3]|eukprot:XP_001313227.1 hypothetical protein [Trichomonas vaginalis G3]